MNTAGSYLPPSPQVAGVFRVLHSLQPYAEGQCASADLAPLGKKIQMKGGVMVSPNQAVTDAKNLCSLHRLAFVLSRDAPPEGGFNPFGQWNLKYTYYSLGCWHFRRQGSLHIGRKRQSDGVLFSFNCMRLGRSLRPIVTDGGSVSWRDNVYAEIERTGRMVRPQRYKYVRFYEYSGEPDRPFLTADDTATQFVPGQGADYRENPVRLLFDRIDDPWETNNLYCDSVCASVLEEHKTILREQWEAHLIPGTHYDRN